MSDPGDSADRDAKRQRTDVIEDSATDAVASMPAAFDKPVGLRAVPFIFSGSSEPVACLAAPEGGWFISAGTTIYLVSDEGTVTAMVGKPGVAGDADGTKDAAQFTTTRQLALCATQMAANCIYSGRSTGSLSRCCFVVNHHSCW